MELAPNKRLRFNQYFALHFNTSIIHGSPVHNRPPVALMVVLTRVLHLILSYLFPVMRIVFDKMIQVTKKNTTGKVLFDIEYYLLLFYVLLVCLFLLLCWLLTYFLLLVLLRLLCAEPRKRKFLPCDKKKNQIQKYDSKKYIKFAGGVLP